MPKKELYKCCVCGQELTDNNCRPNSKNYSGYSAYCLDCEEQRFAEHAEAVGKYLALYCACVQFDVPLIPLVLDGIDLEAIDKGWGAYLDRLVEQNELFTDDGIKGFTDGVTTVWQLFGNEQKYTDFNARIRMERDAINAKNKKEKERKEKQVGSDEQIAKWGSLPIVKGLAMSQQLYDELDRLYAIRADSYKGQDLNSQQIATLIKCAKNDAIYDHFMRTGMTKPATDIQKTTSQLLADENMRPKDKKPVEELRLDALVLSLEEAGLMENGDLLNYDELIEVLRDKFIKSKKYNYSLDVADQMILDIRNCMAINGDLPTIQDLPEELAPVDEYGEFEAEETEREKENKKFLGVTKVNIVKSKKKKGERK